MQINITTKDIEYAERILLPEGKFFDNERRNFIQNLNTIDLQAAPGSGKTTALLAKLLIIEKYMPFDDGSGILVISHTNAAIDEIKHRIEKYCPKLFTYPNYIGTIQGFVDKFLAIPFYINTYKKKPYRIDNEIYDEKIERYYEKFIKGKSTWIDNRSNPIDFLKKIRYSGNWDLIQSFGKNADNFSPAETTSTSKQFIIPMKNNMMKFGYLHFDDAYFLANLYFQKFPLIKKLLQKRFKFVFVDEMQDMDKHQYDLLESIFHANIEECFTKYQRIGDLNQAIHSSISANDCWLPRSDLLELSGSHRLTPETAEVIKYFGLNYQEVEGLRESFNIKPHIIVFDNVQKVLPKFIELIKGKQLNDDNYPFCAIGWTGDYKYQDREKINPDKSKLTIKCYHESFEKKYHNTKIDHSCLKDYLKYYDKNDNSLASIRKNILKIFVKILRIENIKDESCRNYTTRKFINFLREKHEEKYKEFKLKLFTWSFSIKKGEEIYDDLKDYIRSFFNEIFTDNLSSEEIQKFINLEESSKTENANIKIKVDNPNIFREQDITVKIGTIHSVKGETHTATLYMESFYYNDGGNSYESQRLVEQLNGNTLSDSVGKRVKQSAKMVYVGCSRPTHLLCFAIHKSRMSDDFNNDNWEVIHIT